MKKSLLMKKLLLTCAALCLITGFTSYSIAGQDNWRQEFDRICSYTGDADQLSIAELTKLIDDSEKLTNIIKSKEDSDVKIYLIRLKKCRGLFVFMREVAMGKN